MPNFSAQGLVDNNLKEFRSLIRFKVAVNVQILIFDSDFRNHDRKYNFSNVQPVAG